jgi:tetratricopeptide (TPR) repeat protein
MDVPFLEASRMTFNYQEELSSWKKKIEEANRAYSKRRYSQAEVQFLDALKQAESWPEVEDKSEQTELQSALSKSLNNLAAIFHAQGKYAMAEEIYIRSLAIKKALFGEESLDYALNLQNLAACYSAKGRYDEAEKLFTESLAIRERLLGKDHPELSTTLRNFALLLKKIGRHEDATSMEARATNLEKAHS